MTELYLLRHGIAAERGDLDYKNDADRPLVAKGRRELRRTAAALRKSKLRFDLVLSSPILRARQTAEIVAAELKLKKRLEFSDALKHGGNAKTLVAELNRRAPAPETVLLVGHEPDMGELISILVTGKTDAGFALKKGGLAKLDIAGKLSAGRCAALVWLLTPKLMARMA
jgi:phosphohistidine phosphatase